MVRLSSSSFIILVPLLFSLFWVSGLPLLLSAHPTSPKVNGLSWDFYRNSCPQVETIIRDHLRQVFQDDIGQAAGLLRLHFHDCFVQGCDGSILLDGSASMPSEKDAPPNLTLRPEAFTLINDLRDRLQTACGSVVSCSDILTLAARDSVFLSGGPDYRVPLGRRDALTFASQNETLRNLPPPTANTSFLLSLFSTNQNLSVFDLVALSGAHTIGISHCTSFTGRLYPNQDPTMDPTLANKLKSICPIANSTNTTVMDVRTPKLFDNRYFVGLMKQQGLFTSDQDMFTDWRTRLIVTAFAWSQTLFFKQFELSMVKMGQLGVLTGTQGEVRANCSARNGALSATVVDGGVVEKMISAATYR